MSKAPKFMFDRDFDDEELAAAKPAAQDVEEIVDEAPVEPVEVPPTFTEDDMAAARGKAFAEGRKQGTDESLNSFEAKLTDTLDQIGAKLTGIVAEQKASHMALRDDTAALCGALVRKLFPSMNDAHALDEVTNMALTVADGLLFEPRITVKVNESLADTLNERLSGHLTRLNFEGVLVVTGDENMAMGDCLIEWADGSAERDMDRTWRSIDDIVARHVGHDANAATPVHEPSEAAAAQATAPVSGDSGTQAAVEDGHSPDRPGGDGADGGATEE